MAQVRSKQIADFSSSVNWTTATASQIPNSYDIKQNFLAKEQMVVEEFTNQTISSTSQWNLTLTDSVYNNDAEYVSVYVNGFKTDGVLSVTGTTLTIAAYAYDIDTNDTIKVHYVKNY